MNNRLRVLHITPDNKFFDSVITAWETYANIENSAIFIAQNPNYQLKYIKNTNKIDIIWNKKKLVERLLGNDYDVIYLHSLPAKLYKYINYIPSDRTVIWWGWGYDIYQSKRGLPPLVKLPLYKPLTKKFQARVNKSLIGLLRLAYWTILRTLWSKRRNEALTRIDYFQPVLTKEYRIICLNKFFRAKEFYCKYQGYPFEKINIVKSSTGDILLGNSATPTNNHLDVLEVVRSFKQEKQKIIMPLNYGNKLYTEWLKPQIQGDDIIPLYDFLPKDEYFKIVEDCSYAVIGTVRQQAMGNISFALSKGIKVFLYKESLAYQDYKERGYVVYAIEDMTFESLSTPLSVKEMDKNRQAFIKEQERRWGIFDRCVEEMMIKHNKTVC